MFKYNSTSYLNKMDNVFESFKDRGLTGLANLGNTCFINSCMQILSHTYEFNLFLDKKYSKRKKSDLLLYEWNQLRKMMWQSNCIISPQKFIRTVQQVAADKNIETFTGFAQNDVPEFFLFLMDGFHTALSREIQITITGNPKNETDQIAIQCFELVKKMYSKNYSEIWKLFYGIHVSVLLDPLTGEKIQITPEPYLMVDLSIPADIFTPTLMECFDHYVQGEVLDGDNGWTNETTQEKKPVQKQILFWSFPEILVIGLKRFTPRQHKNQKLVTFPLEGLDLSKYVMGYKKDTYIYHLYGVCNHSGGLLGGHYTAHVKNANDKWYHFNDTHVTEVGLVEHSIVTPKAYVLFYRRVAT